MDRVTLEARWLALTRETLPALAAARGWPVRADHCFQRILLDHVCGGCWYDHVAGRPAYRHMSDEALRHAVDTAAAAAAGTVDLHRLDARSLRYRSARKAGERGPGRGGRHHRGDADGQEQGSGG